jgi:hypothetical protein
VGAPIQRPFGTLAKIFATPQGITACAESKLGPLMGTSFLPFYFFNFFVLNFPFWNIFFNE